MKFLNGFKQLLDCEDFSYGKKIKKKKQNKKRNPSKIRKRV